VNTALDKLVARKTHRPGQGPYRRRAARRKPGGASNPYPVGAAAIAAGLDGVRNHIAPPPVTEGLAMVWTARRRCRPGLEAALDALEKDTVLRGLRGEDLIRLFLTVKRPRDRQGQ